MVSVNILLDTRSRKKDGTHPLTLRVIINRKFFQIPLGYSIPEKDWSETGQKIKASCKLVENVTRLNALIHKQKQKAFDIISRLQTEERLYTLSLDEIKRMISDKEEETMLLSYSESVIADL